MKAQFATMGVLAALWTLPAYAWTHDDIAQQSLGLDFRDAREPSGYMRFQTPRGWETCGDWTGTHPDERFVVTIESPDQHARIQLGDGKVVSSFVPPSPQLPRGSQFDRQGVRLEAQNYASGMQFASAYATALYSRSCAQFEVTDVISDRQPKNIFVFPTSRIQGESSGLAFFTCKKPDGVIFNGVVHATTVQSLLSSGEPYWYVGWLWHYTATPSAAPQTFLVARRVTDSIQVDPQWVEAHFPPPQAPRVRPAPSPSPSAPGVFVQPYHHTDTTGMLNALHGGTTSSTGQQQYYSDCVNSSGQYVNTNALNCNPGLHHR